MAAGLNFSSAMLSSMASGIKRTEVQGLPKGWIREEVPRFNPSQFGNGLAGLAAAIASGDPGGVDVVYYSPRGHRVKTKAEMSKLLGDQYDLTPFDFQTGKINPVLLRTMQQQQQQQQQRALQQHQQQQQQNQHHSSRKPQNGPTHKVKQAPPAAPPPPPAPVTPPVDNTLVPPIRQTASIFKQPVTVVKSAAADETNTAKAPKSKDEGKSPVAEKPRQLFWEKRLSGIRASYPDEQYEPISLPNNLRPVGPGVEDDVVLASISTSLHLSSGAISGQSNVKKMTEKDPSVYLTPDQPLVCSTKVSQSDVDRQEARVLETRKKLAEALAALTA